MDAALEGRSGRIAAHARCDLPPDDTVPLNQALVFAQCRASGQWCHSAPPAQYVRRLPCSAKYRVALDGTPHCASSHAHTRPEPPPKGPLVPVRSLDCYDPALVALLHASPIASWWRRRRILARRNLIRQAAPPGPSARGSPKSSQPNKKAAARRRPPERFCPAFLLLCFFCFPPICTTRPQLYSTPLLPPSTTNSFTHFFCSPKLDTYTTHASTLPALCSDDVLFICICRSLSNLINPLLLLLKQDQKLVYQTRCCPTA